MSLRHKTLLIVGISISCVFIALSLILSSLWLRSFAELENQQTHEVVERVQNALADDLEDLNSTLSKWADQDDTYTFIENSNRDYIEANLSNRTLANLELNVVLFVDNRGRVVFRKGFDVQPKKAAPLVSRIQKHLTTHPQLWQHTQSNSSRKGILVLPEGSFLVASQPILRNERKGDIRGTLIFGRYLDTAKLKRLEVLTQTSITLEPFNEKRLPKDWQRSNTDAAEPGDDVVEARNFPFNLLDGENRDRALDWQKPNTALSAPKVIVVHSSNPVRITGYTQLPDIYGNPGLLLRVDSPRASHGTARTSWHYVMISLVGAGLLLAVIILLMFEKFVLSRLTHLAAAVNRMSITGDLSQRFRDKGRDELSQLSMAINHLLTALQEFRTQLHQGNTELERRVEQRTADLIQANLRLEASHREKDALLKREQEARAASEAARREAEAANRIKDEFLAILSHELRTPLNPILGWSKILRTRKPDEKTVARALETIERNAQLQTQLIDDLLDVSRILQGKLSLKICPVDVVATIEAAIETVRLAAQAKSIEINTVVDANLGYVSGDPNRLQQVVWNLLSNAVKFTPTGGKVEIRLDRKTTHVQISVRDTGKGINPDFLPHVFDYFRQEDSTTTRTFGGLGLGLAIVRHLVELHGGTVGAESPGEGLGATFSVTFPLMDTMQQACLDNELPKNSSNLEGIKVLIVDDEVDTLELITFTLEQYGATVKAVTSPHLVLEVLAMWQPDVLLSDIAMPDMDGYKLIHHIRSKPPEQGGEIPAIALTAYAGEINQQKALRAGFTAHITKPVEPSHLAGVVAKVASA